MTKERTATEWSQGNRDLLVELKTQMSGVNANISELRQEVKEIKDGVKADVEFLKSDKISRAEAIHINTNQQVLNADVETRLRWHDKVIYGGLGVLAAVEFAFKFLIK